MTEKIYLSFRPFPGRDPQTQINNLGNIADDVWKDKIVLLRGDIIDGRYIGTLQILADRPLRKKERDELKRRIKHLGKTEPELDPKVMYSKEDI